MIVAASASVLESTKVLNAAFVASAHGDWDKAGEVFCGLVEEDDANYAVRSTIHSFVMRHAWLARVLMGCLSLFVYQALNNLDIPLLLPGQVERGYPSPGSSSTGGQFNAEGSGGHRCRQWRRKRGPRDA